MDSILKQATIAFVLLALAFLLRLGFSAMRSNEEASNSVIAHNQTVTSKISNSKFVKYDGKTVTGDAVVNAIDKFSTELDIVVYNDSTRTVFPSAGQAQVLSESEPCFIYTNYYYNSTLLYNANGFVDGIEFRKAGPIS